MKERPCAVCHGRMIYVGFPEHPSCSDADGAAIIRAQHAKAEGIARAIASGEGEHRVALAIIQRVATEQQILSANDLLAVAEWEQINGKVRGAAVNTAVRRGWLVKVGYETSSNEAAHGHEVRRYRSTLYAGRAA